MIPSQAKGQSLPLENQRVPQHLGLQREFPAAGASPTQLR